MALHADTDRDIGEDALPPELNPIWSTGAKLSFLNGEEIFAKMVECAQPLEVDGISQAS